MDLSSASYADKSNSARAKDGGRVKKMKLQKHSNLLLKLVALFLILGLGFIISRDSTAPLARIEIKSPLMGMNDSLELKPPPADSEASSLAEESSDQEQVTGEDATVEECDLFTGDWIRNPSGPAYTNESCPFIESHQNCMKNGRPDTGYLYWRWNPRHCELHQFDAVRFLELMRSKSWALIGDSISRNHVQSLLCLLAVAEKPMEVYHDEEYKSRRWHFRSYNFTISVLWSPFLVKAAIYEDQNGVSTSEVKLHLDELDPKWTTIYKDLDYAILSTGKWFLKNAIYYRNSTPVGCHNCDPTRNITEVGFGYAYQSTLDLVMSFVATTPNKGMVFFRTSTPDHFEGGEWHNGGTCERTGPDKDGAVELKDINRILRDIELKEFEKAAGVAERKGVNLQLLDFTSLLLKRPDGHPGPYRQFQPFGEGKKVKQVQNDCLHWCLPGPIDAWNDVIMDMVVNAD